MDNTPLGTPVRHADRNDWVQVERKSSEAWASLCLRRPAAASLLHHLVANMGPQNAVVIPQRVLSQLIGRSIDTVQRAIQTLVAERWIQVVRLGKGKEAAYVINDRVAWSQRRDQLHLSTFSATVVADLSDQDEASLGHGDLRRLPTIRAGERQLHAGPGAEPPSQPAIDGIEHDLPAIRSDD